MKFYKSWKKPKAISFDLDDTLYDNRPIMHRAESKCQQWMAQQCEAFAHWSVVDWEAYRQESARMAPEMAQDMTALRLFTLMRALREQGFSKTDSRQLADDAFHCFWHYRNDFQVSKEVVDELQELGEHYPLLVITNGNADPDKIGLGGLFTQILHPKLGELKSKPHTDLFYRAEQLTNMTGQQWLHVGDHLNTDVNGALQAGWQAAWFNHEHTAIPDCKPTACLPNVELGRLEELRELLV